MRTRVRSLGAMAMAAAAAIAVAAIISVRMALPASAASLVQITNFGNNPCGLQMYVYVPDNARPHPPVLLALHQCTGSGPGFYSGTEFASLANQYGFIVIYPSANRSGSCWDVSSSQALTRNGGSDPVGLMSMITYTEQHYGGDPNQVYVTGASSGAMMTNVMLGDYPDVFKAGAAFMGVPFGCFAPARVDGWNTACAQGQVIKTPQAVGRHRPQRRSRVHRPTAADAVVARHGRHHAELQQLRRRDQAVDQRAGGQPDARPPRTRRSRAGPAPATTAAPAPSRSRRTASRAPGTCSPLTGMAAYAIHFFGLDSVASPPPSSPPPTSPPPTSPPPAGTCHVSYTPRPAVGRRLHGQHLHHQYRHLHHQRLEADIQLPGRPEDHRRLEHNAQPERHQRHSRQRQLQRIHQPRRERPRSASRAPGPPATPRPPVSPSMAPRATDLTRGTGSGSAGRTSAESVRGSSPWGCYPVSQAPGGQTVFFDIRCPAGSGRPPIA